MTLLLLTLLAQSPRGAEAFAAPSVSVTVTWPQEDAHLVSGFRVYLRRFGSNYTTYRDAGKNQVFTFTGLQRKTNYKAFVTYYIGDYESPRSEELSFRTGSKSGDAEEL